MLLVHLYVNLLLKGKRIFVVAGARRSGNHAFINWITNALEDAETGYDKLSDSAWRSSSGRTLLLNEVNYIGVIRFVDLLRSLKKPLADASIIIISLEDYIPEKSRHPFVPASARKIAITRSTLNLFASRIQRATKQARKGLDRGDMAIDNKLLKLINWLYDSKCQGWTRWHYDSWVTDAGYRRHFLDSFALSNDLLPNISTHGDGSSFSGRDKIPSQEELLNRWQAIEWPHRVIELLITESESSILDEDELHFIRERALDGDVLK